MAQWLQLAAWTNLVYCGAFAVLAVRTRTRPLALALGIVHLLLTAALSVAPFRSFFDPDYPGFGLGLLHFEKRAATLPTAILLAWALSSALILASRRSGYALWVVAIGDSLFALNQLVSLLFQPASSNDIQLGEYLTIGGIQALVIMLVLFVGGPTLSAGWAARHAHRT